MATDRPIDVHRDVPVEMRDGTELAADIYRPGGDGPWPVLLMRLPYGKTQGQVLPGMYNHPSWYARQGYIVVVQDTRGRYDSEGEFRPFHHEETDGYDTVEWAADMDGSNGKVGMYGFSYVGALQLQAAARQPPSLTCIAPGMNSVDFHDGWVYRGGAFSLAFNVSWARFLAIDTAQRRDDDEAMAEKMAELGNARYDHLPLEEFPGFDELAPYFHEWIDHETNDDYWQSLSLNSRFDEIDVPAFHVAGWYDTFLEGTLKNYSRMVDMSGHPQKLRIFPWWHTPWSARVGSVDFGPEAANEFDREQLRWFDRWLKEEENGYLEEPNVGMFVMGANTWRHADRWPPSDVEYTRFYLHGREPANAASGAGRLNRTAPGEEPPDVYPYDPRNPVQSIGGRSCCDPNVAPVGPADQRPNYARNDILLYTSEPLSEPVEVTGPVSATLHVSSSAPDTDFVVKLIDVHPDGRAINVAEGILRARYRNARSDPEPLVQGEIHEIEVDLAATSNVFKQGHRIQVYVTSSDFPQYDRNPNTGGDIASCNHADFETATQTLYHDRDRPSHVTLPLLPSPVSE